MSGPVCVLCLATITLGDDRLYDYLLSCEESDAGVAACGSCRDRVMEDLEA